MNKKGIMWDDVKNLLIVLLIIAIVLWALKSTVGDGTEKISDCKKNGGYCSEICGQGSYATPYSCDKKAQICCYDELAIRGEGAPTLTTIDPNQLGAMTCTQLDAELYNANKAIWINMAMGNPGNATCRMQGDNYGSVNPCDKDAKHYGCTYGERDGHCKIHDDIVKAKTDHKPTPCE